MQIIAAAGSGKTEVVSQRVAQLLADGQPAESIVAFTFTERTADEPKNRIAHRVEDRLGTAALDRLGTANRFPTTCAGEIQQWLVPRNQFNAARYEGGDGDERRLFYVALTRARDWLSVSRHGRVNKNTVAASPYYRKLAHLEVRGATRPS